jgi:hypothetical protein
VIFSRRFGGYIFLLIFTNIDVGNYSEFQKVDEVIPARKTGLIVMINNAHAAFGHRTLSFSRSTLSNTPYGR